MNIDLAMVLTEDMLWAALLLAGPILGISLLVGLLVSIFQVITQIQEMTLTFVPKLAAVALVIVVLGAWMLTTLAGFSKTLIMNIPAYF